MGSLPLICRYLDRYATADWPIESAPARWENWDGHEPGQSPGQQNMACHAEWRAIGIYYTKVRWNCQVVAQIVCYHWLPTDKAAVSYLRPIVVRPEYWYNGV